MPGSGKSYVGEKLSQSLGFSFADPDKILEYAKGKPLQEILESLGEEAFLLEEADLSIASLEGTDEVVLATGGSIVYSEKAMEELNRLSKIVYLKVGFETIQQRIKEAPRGIVGLENRSLAELFKERTALYEKWASITIDASQEAEEVVEEALKAIKSE